MSELTLTPSVKEQEEQGCDTIRIKSTVKGLLPLLPFVMHLVVYNECGGVNRVICMNDEYLAMKVRNMSAPAKGRLPCMPLTLYGLVPADKLISESAVHHACNTYPRILFRLG